MSRSRVTFDLGRKFNSRETVFKLPNDIASRRSAIFGISGSGKSNTATVCIEGLVANGEQVVLVDPKGEGWGLKSSADGKSAGLDVIVFGEPRGDIEALDETHAERLADFVVESGRSIVLSMLGFDSDQSERRFVTRFFQRLYRRKSRQARPTRTLVVLEEAHLFVPESSGAGYKGDVAQMVGAIQRIARQGRSVGLGLMIVDQRPQDVSKKIISQTEILICHQLVHKLDRDALRHWVSGYDRDGQGKEFMDSLAGLDQGVAWAWSPGWLKVFEQVQINLRTTFDSGATPDGKGTAAPTARSKINLDELRDQLSEVVQKAEQDDPVKLRKQIATLTRELKTQQSKPTVDQAAIDLAVNKAVLVQDDYWKNKISSACKQLESVSHSVKFTIDALSAKADKHEANSLPSRSAAPTRSMPAKKTPARPRPADSLSPGSTQDLTPIQTRVLASFGWWHDIGVESVTRQQAGLKAGYTNSETSSFRKALYALKDAGLLDEAMRSLTHLGQSHRPPTIGPEDMPAYHAMIAATLNAIHLRAFTGAVQLTGSTHKTTRAELAEHLGYTNIETSSFRKALYRLQTMGLIDLVHGGGINATDLLFPESLGGGL